MHKVQNNTYQVIPVIILFFSKHINSRARRRSSCLRTRRCSKLDTDALVPFTSTALPGRRYLSNGDEETDYPNTNAYLKFFRLLISIQSFMELSLIYDALAN